MVRKIINSLTPETANRNDRLRCGTRFIWLTVSCLTLLIYTLFINFNLHSGNPAASDNGIVLVDLTEFTQHNAHFPTHNDSHPSRTGNKIVATSDTASAGTILSDDVGQQKQHIVFSSGCSRSQDWQSYLFFYQSMAIQQPGDIVRIASGCRTKQRKQLELFHKKYIAPMSNRFHVHFTPEFGRRGDPWTMYWNKPFGVKHWMENTLGYSDDHRTNVHDDDIVILLDPDMVLLKPLINDFRNDPNSVWLAYLQNKPTTIRRKVEHGKPIAQQYGYGLDWLKRVQANLTDIVGPNSPVHKITADNSARRAFTCGPPYILTSKDMYQLSTHWAAFVPTVYDVVDDFMAEMYAYSIAAAHLGLRHQSAKGFMVSNVIIDTEGWFLFEDDPELESGTSCGTLGQSFEMDPSRQRYRPYIIHYCQHFAIGNFAFWKYSLPTDLFTNCESPLLIEAPVDAARKYSFSNFSNGKTIQYDTSKDLDSSYRRRNAHMVCSLLPVLNRAATYFKTNYCDASTANMNKTLFL